MSLAARARPRSLSTRSSTDSSAKRRMRRLLVVTMLPDKVISSLTIAPTDEKRTRRRAVAVPTGRLPIPPGARPPPAVRRVARRLVGEMYLVERVRPVAVNESGRAGRVRRQMGRQGKGGARFIEFLAGCRAVERRVWLFGGCSRCRGRRCRC